jgi:hypothetical protein
MRSLRCLVVVALAVPLLTACLDADPADPPELGEVEQANDGTGDWTNDPTAWDVDWRSTEMLNAYVEQPLCSQANGSDCGPPGPAGLRVPVLRCKSARTCGGDWHLGCKLFGQCISRRGCGVCYSGPPTLPLYSGTNTNGGTINVARDPVFLFAGETVDVGTCGLTGASRTGDTYLRLYYGSTQVASNDNACGGTGSRITYTATQAGVYMLHSGCAGNTSCSGQVVANVTGTPSYAGELGRVALWTGKVNIHKSPGGSWVHDTNCSSGSTEPLLAYCKKYWPTTSGVARVPVTTKGGAPWRAAGCAGLYAGNGEDEYACLPPAELGRIALWSGKVNLRKAPGGSWTTDSDCTSGASIAPLTYCRKFWPATVSVTSVSPMNKTVWKDAGCTGSYSAVGQTEYTCNQ